MTRKFKFTFEVARRFATKDSRTFVALVLEGKRVKPGTNFALRIQDEVESSLYCCSPCISYRGLKRFPSGRIYFFLFKTESLSRAIKCLKDSLRSRGLLPVAKLAVADTEIERFRPVFPPIGQSANHAAAG